MSLESGSQVVTLDYYKTNLIKPRKSFNGTLDQWHVIVLSERGLRYDDSACDSVQCTWFLGLQLCPRPLSW